MNRLQKIAYYQVIKEALLRLNPTIFTPTKQHHAGYIEPNTSLNKIKLRGSYIPSAPFGHLVSGFATTTISKADMVAKGYLVDDEVELDLSDGTFALDVIYKNSLIQNLYVGNTYLFSRGYLDSAESWTAWVLQDNPSNSGYYNKTQVDTKILAAINALKDGVDLDYDTLKELADAIEAGNDEDVTGAELEPGADDTDPFGDGSLVHFYKFNDNVLDAITGIYASENGSTAYAAAKFDNGLAFTNDTNSIVAVNDEIPVGTISFYAMFIDDITTKIVSGSGSGMELKWWTNGDRISLSSEDGTSNGTNDLVETTVNTSYFDGNIVHIALTFNGTTFKLYYDGVVINEGNTVFKLPANMQIGTNDHNGVPQQIIDHLQVFDRELTQDEVTQLYNAEVE